MLGVWDGLRKVRVEIGARVRISGGYADPPVWLTDTSVGGRREGVAGVVVAFLPALGGWVAVIELDEELTVQLLGMPKISGRFLSASLRHERRRWVSGETVAIALAAADPRLASNDADAWWGEYFESHAVVSVLEPPGPKGGATTVDPLLAWPVIVTEGLDLHFCDPESLALIEPWFPAEPHVVAYDREGRAVKLVAPPLFRERVLALIPTMSWRGVVQARALEEEPRHQAELAALLRDYLLAVPVRPNPGSVGDLDALSLSELVDRALTIERSDGEVGQS
ncbi:MAG: hypothetical protein JHC95_22725 [Solirubrobacteraceae bacterium]|nr:hypothetical protein [Solirubrobacteraceae bacterium]